MRVKVWNGDKSQYLGLGNYVGDVSVYVYMTKEGTLRSLANAEQKPDTIPEGCELRQIPNNPKIVLDNGRVVYGCQTWWQPVQEVVEVEEEAYDPWAVSNN